MTPGGDLVRRLADVALDQEIVTKVGRRMVHSTVSTVRAVERVKRTDMETETTSQDGTP